MLVIFTENVKILFYIINIPWVLKHERYFTYEGILTRVNFFTENRIDQCEFMLPRLIMYRQFEIVNIHQTYNMIRLITNVTFTFPRKDDQGNLE